MKIRFCIGLLFSVVSLTAQSTERYINIGDIQPDKEITQNVVKKIYSDSLTTSFVIWVYQAVPLHKHAVHTEQVYVLEGEADMRVGEETIHITPGDIIFIPAGTAHSVKVTSPVPLKVLSVQSPEFLGDDRIPLE